MKKLLLITGDIAAGKSTFSRILSKRYHVAAFQKDTVKEILSDSIGYRNRGAMPLFWKRIFMRRNWKNCILPRMKTGMMF